MKATPIVALAMVLASCTTTPPPPRSEPDPSPSQQTPAGEGILRIAGGSIDHLDPAKAYTTTSWFLARGVFRTLVAPGRATADEARPPLAGDLASDAGTAEEGWTRWTFTIREGARFGRGLGGRTAPGITGAGIECADLKFTFERLLRPETEAAYSFYYDVIEGAREVASGAADELTGITCPDDRTIVFDLERPVPDWPQRLSLPATAPVPQQAATLMDDQELDYSQLAFATGPYFIRRADPGETMVLARDRAWNPRSDPVRTEHGPKLVRWRVDLSTTDAVARIRDGRLDLTVGLEPRGRTLAGLVASRAMSRNLIHEPSGCLRAIYLDTTRPPFDDANARMAVAHAIDRYALQRMYGGPATGEVATGILPPGLPGHLGRDRLDPFTSPHGTGDVEGARRMLSAAGFSDWDRAVVIAGDQVGGPSSILASVKTDLERLGFTNVRTRSPGEDGVVELYRRDPAVVHVGTAAAWCKDFDDASTILRPLFHSEAIGAAEGFNFPRVADPQLDRLIDAATALPVGTERTDAWKRANERATELAAWIPWSWSKTTILHSDRMRGANYLSFLTQIDWPNVRLRDE